MLLCGPTATVPVLVAMGTEVTRNQGDRADALGCWLRLSEQGDADVWGLQGGSAGCVSGGRGGSGSRLSGSALGLGGAGAGGTRQRYNLTPAGEGVAAQQEEG